MTLFKLYLLDKVLSELSSRKLPFKLSYEIVKLNKWISEETTTFIEAFKKTANEGKTEAELDKELTNLAKATEISTENAPKINLKHFENVEIEPSFLIDLNEFLIEEPSV